MIRRVDTSLTWARNGAILTIALTLLALPLPGSMGGYNDWADWHLATHNLAAILTRLVVFTVAGAALGGLWGHRRRRRHDGTALRHG